jgi:signal peptidase I
VDFDFNLILVPVTLVFFLIWLLDKLVLKQRASKGKAGENPIITWAYDFWPVLAIVLVVRSFLVEPFNIPSESMVPTLQTGDFILVNKYAYGVRLPLAHTKLIDSGSPKRGEVAVFRYPPKPSINYIKRIIGLPNDRIVFHDGQLTVNGRVVAREKLEMGDPSFESFYRETLGAHPHLIRELNGAYSAQMAPFVNTYNNGQFMGRAGRDWAVIVPEGHYFVMGDNRDQSADSRWWGFVADKHLSGRAFYVWMHKESGFKLPSFARNGAIE